MECMSERVMLVMNSIRVKLVHIKLPFWVTEHNVIQILRSAFLSGRVKVAVQIDVKMCFLNTYA